MHVGHALLVMGRRITDADSTARKAFAVRLRAVRVSSAHKKAAQFAAALGVEAETYRRWERAETEPNIATLAKISLLSGASLDFLVTGIINAQLPVATRRERPFEEEPSSPSRQQG